MKVLVNGDGYPLPQHASDPTLFPQTYGPAVVGQESSTVVDNFSNLFEMVQILGSSLAESSPIGVVLMGLYLYTRFVQGKPLFRREG